MNFRFALFFLFLFSINLSSIENILIVYENVEAFPFQTGNSETVNTENGGTIMDLLLLVEKKLNIKITFERMPWDRCFSELESGKADALFYASYKEERLKFGLYPMKDNKLDSTKSIVTISYMLYKLKSSTLNWDGENFTNLTGKIGAPKGYSIVSDLRKMGIDVEESLGTLTDFKKLQAQRISGVAALEEPADFLITKNPKLFKDIEKISIPIAKKDYYLMFSKQFYQKNSKMAEEIWNSIKLLKDSKEYKKIIEKYFKE